MTAVEWLVEKIKYDQNQKALSESQWIKIINQAKEMEKNNYICSKCKCSLDGKDMQQMQDKENT